MGFPYIETNKIDFTLSEIKNDPRLPGGQIDTEYVKETSNVGTGPIGDDSTEEDDYRKASVNSSNTSDHMTENDGLPQWLQRSNLASKK